MVLLGETGTASAGGVTMCTGQKRANTEGRVFASVATVGAVTVSLLVGAPVGLPVGWPWWKRATLERKKRKKNIKKKQRFMEINGSIHLKQLERRCSLMLVVSLYICMYV